MGFSLSKKTEFLWPSLLITALYSEYLALAMCHPPTECAAWQGRGGHWNGIQCHASRQSLESHRVGVGFPGGLELLHFLHSGLLGSAKLRRFYTFTFGPVSVGGWGFYTFTREGSGFGTGKNIYNFTG